MSLQQEMHFKEVKPMETVKKLKSILNKYNIETEEYWLDESSIGTYCVRVTFKGTEIGANGKGVSREFTLASAYAELFERFQNNFLISNTLKLASPSYQIGQDEKIMTAMEIVKTNNEFIKLYFSQRDFEKCSISDKANKFKSVQRLDFLKYGKEDYYVMVPFYSVKNRKEEYLPKNVYQFYYGSNGMCSGNSPYEALVQGISEIVERVVQKKLFYEKPTLPDIPEEYIAKFPYIYDMWNKLKKNKGYVYMLKDCSMGGKYPVAALIILNKNTGNYGIKLGCHPDFGIAMERAFTEATQGQDIFEYTNRSKFDFKNKNVTDNLNIQNSFKVGLAQYPYQIFGKEPTYSFVPTKDVSSMTNKEILNQWVREFINDGYDVLIRDVSYLGFSSYHIIIPGMSEMSNPDDTKMRTLNTRFFVTSLLMNPSKINKDNTKYIIGTLEFFNGDLMNDNLKSYYPMSTKIECLCDDIGCGCIYMIAMCHVLNGNYELAANKMKKIISCANKFGVAKTRIHLYNAMYYYLSGMTELNKHEKVMEYITVLFDENICKKIDNLFKNPEEIIVKQYPTIYDNNESNIVSKFWMKIRDIQSKNPISQINNELLFEY